MQASMRNGVMFSFLLATGYGHAQIPISQARTLPPGTSVTVRGVTTNGGELGSIRYLQDGTAGIAAFPGAGSIGGFTPARGTDVSISGTLKLFNGLLEIDPITSFTVHATGLPDPAPMVIAPPQLGEATESRLVQVNGCILANAGTIFTSGTLAFASAGQSAVVYLRAGHPLVGTIIPSGVVDLIGVVSQYSTATPPVGGYQLLPRGAADLVLSSAITIMGEIAQTDITADGFTLQWTTNLSGSSQVLHGTTSALGSLASVSGSSSMHSVILAGIGPASVHYAKAFSVSGSDTAWSSLGVYSTASADPGSIIVYFNEPVDESVAVGPVAVDLGSAIDDTLRAYIDRAQLTLDIAVYNTTNSSIVAAVNDAVDRGVQVRWIAEASNSNSALADLHPSVPVLYRENSTGSGMHNKFIIADADDGPKAHVITGSCNFTNASFFVDANDLVIVQDQALARAYRMEFNEMWGGSGPSPTLANVRFGALKEDDTPHYFNVNGILVESWFSPSDGTTGRILSSLNTADLQIEFALFAFTMDDLAEVLIELDASADVEVRGMIEEDDMDLGLFQDLINGGVAVLPDGAPNYLHHKYALVDHAAPGSDPQVIVGSHNWSYNAETQNDENTLVIHSAIIVDQFHQEWNARWTTAVGLEENPTRTERLIIHPNPARDWIKIMGLPMRSDMFDIKVLDLSGRAVIAMNRSSGDLGIHLDGLAAGTYVLTASAGMQRWEGRFIRLP